MVTMERQIIEEDGMKRLNKNQYPFATGNMLHKKNTNGKEFVDYMFS